MIVPIELFSQKMAKREKDKNKRRLFLMLTYKLPNKKKDFGNRLADTRPNSRDR